MSDNTRPMMLKEFCKQYSADHPESRRARGGSREMYLAARKAGYDCSESAIHGIRYTEGLGTKYSKMQEAAKKRQAKVTSGLKTGAGAKAREGVRKRRRTKYVSAAAAMAAKLAARRVRRQIAAEQANGGAKAEEPAVILSKTTPTERAFMDAIAQVGLERAKGLVARFEKLARS